MIISSNLAGDTPTNLRCMNSFIFIDDEKICDGHLGSHGLFFLENHLFVRPIMFITSSF